MAVALHVAGGQSWRHVRSVRSCPIECLVVSWRGLPQRLSRKDSACSTGDVGLLPGSGRSPGGGNGGMETHSSILAWEQPVGLQRL